jgi:hypothetical protein
VYFFARWTRATSFLIENALRLNTGVSFKNQSQVTMGNPSNRGALRLSTSARKHNARSSSAAQFALLSTAFAGRL